MPSEVRIEIEETRYDVVPGEPFDVVVHIYNATPIIDGFAPALLGLDPDWAEADEVPLSLFPDDEGDMTLTIELPYTPSRVTSTSIAQTTPVPMNVRLSSPQRSRNAERSAP